MSLDIKAKINHQWYSIKWRLDQIRRKMIQSLDPRISKRNDVWAFPVCYLNGQLFDNARPIFEKICDKPEITKIVLYIRQKPNVSGENVKVLKLHSIRGIWYALQAKVIFVRHCVEQDIAYISDNEKRLIVNLFHGHPLKKIGLQTSADSITGNGPFGAMIGLSQNDTQIMVDSFKYGREDNIWISGFPRNDVLLSNEENLWPAAISELNLIKNRLAGKKLILFAPTFRASWESWEENVGFYTFSDAELSALKEIAKNSNAVIGIRTHLREERSVINAFKDLNVLVFNDIVEPALVLRMTDILITDYSSLVFEFLLTERPVLSFAFDFIRYKEGKGFNYKLEEAFPSDICYDFETLRIELERLTKDNFSYLMTDKHKEVLDFFHLYKDNGSSERVIQKIFDNPKFDGLKH